MKAMLFAAGLGTRLHPFTQNKPKALVEVAGKPLLQWNLERLSAAGFNEIIVNVHHHAGQLIDFIEQLQYPGLSISISDERDQLLDTGGGLKKAGWFFNGDAPFLVHNVDVLTNMDYRRFCSTFEEEQSLAILAVRKRKTSRYLLFNENNLLCGWRNTHTGEEIITRRYSAIYPFAFSGIQLVSPLLPGLIEEEGRFSLIDLYLRLSKTHPVSAFVNDTDNWLDVGKPEQLKKAETLLKQGLL